MTHDPLCPLMIPGTIREAHRTYRCECALIAKVEERAALHHMRDEQADREIADAAGYRRGFAAGLDAAAEAVRKLPKPWARAYLDTDVEAAIAALRGEPC